MAISVRLEEKDEQLVRAYTKVIGVNISDFVRDTIMEKIEDELDLMAYEKAIEEYKKEPVSFTLDDVEKELGLI